MSRVSSPPCLLVPAARAESGTVEWGEFVNAVNALETGSAYDKLKFCFRVYDRDNSCTIEREELLQMFSSMLIGAMGTEKQQREPPSAALQELIEDFVDTIYDSFDVRQAQSPNPPVTSRSSRSQLQALRHA